jgi:hypothetical protein
MRWQTNLDFRELQQYILNEEKNILIMVMVLGQGCQKQLTGFEASIRDKFLIKNKELNLDYRSIKVCFKEEDMPFPIIMTPSLYYFQSKSSHYMFVRHSDDAIKNLNNDLELASKMIGCMTYYEALYDNENDKKLIKETESLLAEPENKKYPTTSKMLKGFAKEMWASAKYAGKGLPVLVNSDVSSERYSICEQCPHLTEVARCTECGCFMKKKVNLAASSCPIGKWDSVQ